MLNNQIFFLFQKVGNLRPTINHRNRNEYVECCHFKEDNLSYALELINKYDFLMSVELKGVYFSIELHQDYKID